MYRRCRASLAEINDQLWYSYLADAQAYPTFEKACDDDPDGLTTYSFSKNPVAARICVKNSALPAYRARSLESMAGIALVFATEQLLRYIKDVQLFREDLSPSNVEVKGATVEGLISDCLEAWGQPLDPIFERSITYLRLRRNHVVHANQEPNTPFASFVRNNGAYLNKSWEARPAQLPELDFATTEGGAFTQPESISLMNLCRICLASVDEAIVRSIPVDTLAKQYVVSFAKSNKQLNGSTVERRFRKFKRQFECQFGLPLTYDVQQFGAQLLTTEMLE